METRVTELEVKLLEANAIIAKQSIELKDITRNYRDVLREKRIEEGKVDGLRMAIEIIAEAWAK
jgi:hypothetical protein